MFDKILENVKNINEEKIPSSTIEKLAQKYFEVTGQSPEYAFWDWLAVMQVEPTEQGLLDILNDEEIWDDLKLKED